ncbi:MAG: hypothetical protein HY906_08880 [Deltaproteobacteria bacterium]|nr:hypothetical protein [Deltaproteobacteria bacterium]
MTKEAQDIVLVCNPRAGGRWKQLAGILDSAEAQHVRRIVTDSIDDIGPALASLGRRVRLVVVYGGDGTIQQILTDIFRSGDGTWSGPAVGMVGGGTMNLTSRWCGWRDAPEENFIQIVHDAMTDKLATREVPMLKIQQGARVEYGFLFAAGSPIRVLNEYEHGRKSRIAAVVFFARTIVNAFNKNAHLIESSLDQMRGEILLDGVPLPYNDFVLTACSITGSLQIGMQPFVGERGGDTFYSLAYAVSAREIAVLLPFLARAMLPIDPKSLLQPVSQVTHIGLSYFGQGSLPLPLDPRYINHPVKEYELRSAEKVYTIDGEIFESTGEPIKITTGPTLRLAIKA